MEFILTTPEQLKSVIQDAVHHALKHKSEAPILPDRCTLEEAIEVTGVSKSKIYKLTSTGSIPCKRFGSRLIFSRKELEAWVDSQTVDKNGSDNIDLALAKSARKKKGGRNA